MKKNNLTHGLLIFLMFFTLAALSTAYSQDKLQPRWWFGLSGGANFNSYNGDIKTLRGIPIPANFKKGSGTGLFLAPFLEYRPDPVWGGMLHIGYDGRGGSFDKVNEQTLTAKLNYLTVEPALRITPFDLGLHFFIGPTLGFNIDKSYEYGGATKETGDFDKIRGTLFGGKVGLGYDVPLTNPDANVQVALTPFTSLHIGQEPRTIEKWSLMTVRVGLALKFGNTREVKKIAEREVQFSVRAPKVIPIERKVKETFPIRNYIFFDELSTSIPTRYIQLTKEQADKFKEEQLVEAKPTDMTGRSARQLKVYYNVLNIFGDRMRNMPNTTIKLSGSSEKGAAEGKKMAESVKAYLVDVFGINPNRIEVAGTVKPSIPSTQPGGTRELNLTKPEDRRVEITSQNIDLLLPIEIISYQEEPVDGDVILNIGGAEEILSSYMIEFTDNMGKVQSFGPFTSDRERINGKTILGDKAEDNYKVTLVGQTKGGLTVRKEENIRLVLADKPEDQLGLRFSVLFEFDQSKTIATYEKFLSKTVTPLIPENGSVVIHGHTDIIGEESHNLKLSRERANDAMQVIERELLRIGKSGVKFDTYGFGEDVRRAPFENRNPEERFYNRTVIIDIVPD